MLGDRDPTTADLPRLKYTEYVVQEVMRLYPPAYGMGRLALEPLELGGYLITPGTTCFLSQWVSHRDERYFPQPEAFRPERWENDLARRIPKFAYYPFGGGPRVCIGSTLAMLEAVLVVATIARRFRFELVADQQVVPWPSITLRPRSGVRAICREATTLKSSAAQTPTKLLKFRPNPYWSPSSAETVPTSAASKPAVKPCSRMPEWLFTVTPAVGSVKPGPASKFNCPGARATCSIHTAM